MKIIENHKQYITKKTNSIIRKYIIILSLMLIFSGVTSCQLNNEIGDNTEKQIGNNTAINEHFNIDTKAANDRLVKQADKIAGDRYVKLTVKVESYNSSYYWVYADIVNEKKRTWPFGWGEYNTTWSIDVNTLDIEFSNKTFSLSMIDSHTHNPSWYIPIPPTKQDILCVSEKHTYGNYTSIEQNCTTSNVYTDYSFKIIPGPPSIGLRFTSGDQKHKHYRVPVLYIKKSSVGNLIGFKKLNMFAKNNGTTPQGAIIDYQYSPPVPRFLFSVIQPTNISNNVPLTWTITNIKNAVGPSTFKWTFKSTLANYIVYNDTTSSTSITHLLYIPGEWIINLVATNNGQTKYYTFSVNIPY